MKIKVYALITVLMAFAGSVYGREIGSSSPERQGFSSDQLDRLTQFMEAKVDDGTMVGGLGVIARNGKVIYSEPFGKADREAGRVMEEDAIFRIYSMTKPITGVALMMLYEEGKFRLNDPIAWYMPELANLEVALSTAGTAVISDGTVSRGVGETNEELLGKTRKPKRQPTIRDLLIHTAGFTYGIFGNTEVDQLYRQSSTIGIMDQRNLQQFVQDLGKLPLQYEPGAQWHYSVSVDVQGRLVEVLSGMSFGEFLKTRLFEPLDMKDTAFFVPSEKQSRLAQLYKPAGLTELNFMAPTTGKGLEVADAYISAGFLAPPEFESGGAGLVSTARDYLRFAQMMLNGGELDGVRILSPKTVQLMTSNHLGDLPMGWGGKGLGFGLGFGLVLEPEITGEVSSAGEFNWGGAAGTRFWVDPEENLIGIFMVQSIPHRTRLAGDFKVLVYSAMTQSQAD